MNKAVDTPWDWHDPRRRFLPPSTKAAAAMPAPFRWHFLIRRL